MMWLSCGSKVGAWWTKSTPGVPRDVLEPETESRGAVAGAGADGIRRFSAGIAATAPTNRTVHTIRARRWRRGETIDGYTLLSGLRPME